MIMRDRELVSALRSGDVSAARACGLLFDAHGAQLYRRCRSMLGDHGAAVTALRDTFVVARAHIDQLGDPRRLAEWLSAIADTECERLRAAVEAADTPRWEEDQTVFPVASLRVRVLTGATAPELAAYHARVARRADRFDRAGFPLPPRCQRPVPPSSYLIPGLIIVACALALTALVVIEMAGLSSQPLTAWMTRPPHTAG
ncbi:hypothetical protein GCM10027294_33110 [Marinactinospora endophytica]